MSIVHLTIDLKVLKTIRQIVMNYILDHPEDENKTEQEICDKLSYIIDAETMAETLNQYLDETIERAKLN